MTRIKLRTRALLDPATLALAPLAASAIAWLLPTSGWVQHGFVQRSALTLDGFLVLAAFYVGLGAVLHLAGRGLLKAVGDSDPTERGDARHIEAALLVAAVFGFLVYLFLLLSRVDVVGALTSAQGNRLDEALDDAIGPQTLRYAVVPFAAHSMARILGRNVRPRYLLGIAMLLVVGMASARLLVVMAVFAAVFTHLARHLPRGWISINAKGLAGVVVLFLALVALTYPRVAGTYAERGITNPMAVTTGNLSTYLSAPFQVQVHVADQVARQDRELSPSERIGPSWELALPTFLRQGTRDGKQEISAAKYGEGLDLRRTLTTNSVFADTIVERGPLGLLVVSAVAALSVVSARLLFRWFPAYWALLGTGLLIYPLLEVWRANIFMLGSHLFILFTLFGAVLGAPLVARRRLPNRAPVGTSGNSVAAV